LLYVVSNLAMMGGRFNIEDTVLEQEKISPRV
jgi:hypothetical protein